MLVKWAIEGRRKTAKTHPSTNDSDQHGLASKSAPTAAASLRVKDHPQVPGVPGLAVEPETTAQALTAQLDRLHYQSDAAFARTAEDEGERAMRRIQAAERDTKLRDDKLLSLGGPQLDHHSSRGAETEPSMPLTEENIERLVYEQGDAESTVARNLNSVDASSSIVNQPHSRSDSRQHLLAQPTLSKVRLPDSEQTITERNARWNVPKF